jgi:hypothetical protein
MGVGGDTYSLVVSPLVALDDLFGTKLQGENLTQLPNIGFSCNSFNLLLPNLGHRCFEKHCSNISPILRLHKVLEEQQIYSNLPQRLTKLHNSLGVKLTSKISITHNIVEKKKLPSILFPFQGRGEL